MGKDKWVIGITPKGGTFTQFVSKVDARNVVELSVDTETGEVLREHYDKMLTEVKVVNRSSNALAFDYIDRYIERMIYRELKQRFHVDFLKFKAVDHPTGYLITREFLGKKRYLSETLFSFVDDSELARKFKHKESARDYVRTLKAHEPIYDYYVVPFWSLHDDSKER